MAVGIYEAVVGASSLLGPFGIALALVAVGVVALWAADENSGVAAERNWMAENLRQAAPLPFGARIAFVLAVVAMRRIGMQASNIM